MACIGIDCRFASLPVGIGTYTRGVVPKLISKLAAHHVVLLVSGQDQSWLGDVPANTTIITVAAKHYSISEQFEIPRRLKQASVDLFFCPHFNVPLRCPCPFVTTIHDLILHRYPNQASLPKRIAYRKLMKHAVMNASHIITVSHYTDSELRKAYGSARKTTVVTEGVHPSFAPLDAEACSKVWHKYNLSSGFWLYVGGAKQHKNVQMLIDAHANIADGSDLVLVTGGREASALKYGDRVHVFSNIDHAQLRELYGSAGCFVTASLYEGFCLPILEARACGCPVIAVNRSAIPEVAGPHTVLVEPDLESLSHAMRNPPTEADPVENKYNWDSVTDSISAILLSSLHG